MISARTNRRMSASWNVPSVTDGRISAFRPLVVNRPLFHHPICTVSPRPYYGQNVQCYRKDEDQQDADYEARQ